jgi:hypothetical protein
MIKLSVSGIIMGTDMTLLLKTNLCPVSTSEKTGAQNSSGVLEIPIMTPLCTPEHGISLMFLSGILAAKFS